MFKIFLSSFFFFFECFFLFFIYFLCFVFLPPAIKRPWSTIAAPALGNPRTRKFCVIAMRERYLPKSILLTPKPSDYRILLSSYVYLKRFKIVVKLRCCSLISQYSTTNRQIRLAIIVGIVKRCGKRLPVFMAAS